MTSGLKAESRSDKDAQIATGIGIRIPWILVEHGRSQPPHRSVPPSARRRLLADPRARHGQNGGEISQPNACLQGGQVRVSEVRGISTIEADETRPAAAPYHLPAAQPQRKTVKANAAADPTRAQAVTYGFGWSRGGAADAARLCDRPNQTRPSGGWSGL